MVIYSGFWAGLLCGFLIAFVVIVAVSMFIQYQEEKTKRIQAQVIDNLHKAAREKVEGSNE